MGSRAKTAEPRVGRVLGDPPIDRWNIVGVPRVRIPWLLFPLPSPILRHRPVRRRLALCHDQLHHTIHCPARNRPSPRQPARCDDQRASTGSSKVIRPHDQTVDWHVGRMWQHQLERVVLSRAMASRVSYLRSPLLAKPRTRAAITPFMASSHRRLLQASSVTFATKSSSSGVSVFLIGDPRSAFPLDSGLTTKRPARWYAPWRVCKVTDLA